MGHSSRQPAAQPPHNTPKESRTAKKPTWLSLAAHRWGSEPWRPPAAGGPLPPPPTHVSTRAAVQTLLAPGRLYRQRKRSALGLPLPLLLGGTSRSRCTAVTARWPTKPAPGGASSGPCSRGGSSAMASAFRSRSASELLAAVLRLPSEVRRTAICTAPTLPLPAAACPCPLLLGGANGTQHRMPCSQAAWDQHQPHIRLKACITTLPQNTEQATAGPSNSNADSVPYLWLAEDVQQRRRAPP